MNCGHCGTAVNKGYSTCPACGAMYQRRPGFFAEIARYTGWASLALGALEVYASDKNAPFLIFFGAACILLNWFLVWGTPYRWYRRNP